MRPSPKKFPSRRMAFTLVELMVAITIIALLIGLLVPALMNVRKKAQIAEVKTDIGEIDAALTAFKTKFGEYPPSRITLYSTAAGWNGDRRSKGIIRKYWSQFDFSSDGAGGSFITGGATSRTLDGAECLMFFLGGVRDSNGKFIGFSTNPAQPFSVTGASRIGPFLEDIENTRVSDLDNDGIPEYQDPIVSSSQPYMYYSAYDGRGYDTADVVTGKPSFYRQGTTPTARGWKDQSYQIISAGFDGSFGPGGAYVPDQKDPLPGTGRDDEADNITNFASGGTLGG